MFTLTTQERKINVDKLYINSPEVIVTDTGTALGRGAYANKTFSSGDVVEICPVILLDYLIREVSLPVQRVIFNWSQLCDAPENYALVLGYGSIYNHADDPNLRYSADPENQIMIYTANRLINKGEQLTVSYNQVPDGAEPRERNWFEIHQVKKIELNPKSNEKQCPNTKYQEEQ